MFLRCVSCVAVALFCLLDVSAQQTDSVPLRVKGNITDRQPDAVYQSTFYGVVEPVKVDLSTQIVAPWQIQHHMVQFRDADVNPTEPESQEERARMEAKLAYREALTSGSLAVPEPSVQQDVAGSASSSASVACVSSQYFTMSYLRAVFFTGYNRCIH